MADKWNAISIVLDDDLTFVGRAEVGFGQYLSRSSFNLSPSLNQKHQSMAVVRRHVEIMKHAHDCCALFGLFMKDVEECLLILQIQMCIGFIQENH